MDPRAIRDVAAESDSEGRREVATEGITLLGRRAFLAATGVAGTGLLLGMKLPPRSRPWSEDAAFQPSAYLGIEPDGRVIIHVGFSEMGQGVLTSLPMLIAKGLCFFAISFSGIVI